MFSVSVFQKFRLIHFDIGTFSPTINTPADFKLLKYCDLLPSILFPLEYIPIDLSMLYHLIVLRGEIDLIQALSIFNDLNYL